jgi:hypothetical protein
VIYIQSHYTATQSALQYVTPWAVVSPNYGYEVGGVTVAVGVAVAVDVAVGVIVDVGDEVKVAVGGWALSLVILGAIHRA